MKDILDTIKDLEKRIENLKETSGKDVLSSYNEATQTEQTLEMYETQLKYYKEKLDPKNNLELGTFFLKNQNNEIFLKLVDSEPDPSQRKISINSTVGKALIDSKVGDEIKIGQDKYTITEIQK